MTDLSLSAVCAWTLLSLLLSGVLCNLEGALHRDLMKGYNKNIRPMENNGDITEVKLKMTLTNLISLSIYGQFLEELKMPRRISPLQDAIHHVITKTDKTSKLEVKYINPLKGRGVFSLAQFSKSDFVVEYRGDRIDLSEAQRRRKICHSLCTTFMFDFKWKGKMWCIDSAKEDGSFGRLVNDDHKHPNCRMKMIEVDGRPHLCLFAIEDIKQGDEITYDYGGDDWPWRKVREDTISKSNTKERQPASLSEPVLSTCSSASDQVREDTISKSNTKERQPASLSEPVLSTCSSASDQRTGKDTISESSAQENCQPLQSGPALSACSSAVDQRTGKDTISESSAQENCQPLQFGPALSACSSASDKVRNSNPEKTAWVTPMFRQSEPLRDHSNDSSSGQSSSEDTDEEDVCVPRLRRTRSVIMRGFVPEDSDELFDSTPDSGEEYIPNSRDERNESSSERSTSLKPVKRSRLSSTDEAIPSNLVPHSTSSGDMGVTERSNLEVMDLNKWPSKSPPVIESDGVCSSSELVQQEGAVVVSAVRRKCDGRRAYDKKHYCVFCLKPFSKMARHLQYVHSSEREVAIACSFPKGSKQRKLHLDNLRHRGNFVHNASVIKTGKGELVPCKRPPKKAQGTDFMHCAYCQGLFTRKVLWRHVKVCKLGPEDCTPKPGKNRVQSLCSFTQPVPSHISKALWKTLSLMNADEITAAVKNDSCIIQLGEHLLNKGGSTAKNGACLRQKLRELGKLLITGRKVASLKTMEDFIHPQNYMKMVQAVRHTCGYDSEANTYKTPSLAKKLGISLMKLSKLVKAKALIAKDHCLAQKLSNFQEIHKERWCELISATAARNLEESKWNAPTVLPFTEDVQKLHAFLNKMQDELIKQLSAEPTSKYWSDLAKVALTQIILFNRRREGEVSCMLLSAFLSRDTSDPHDDIDWALSEVEKKLCRHFSRIVIRGKRGRPVPILLTPKMLNAVELLVKNRETCGVLKDNVYLFARPSAMSHYRGSDCIRSFAKSCNANSPDALTSTKLRKHAATLSTVLNLKDTDMDQLANFLGHDIRIHREFYRLPEKTLQLAKVSKVLMALEQGRLGDFKGKNLDEISIDPNEEMELIDDDEGRSQEEDEKYEELGAIQEESPEATRVTPLDTALMSLPEKKNSPQIPSVKGKTSALKRKAWEVTEIQAVERHLKNFITSCRVPGKAACEKCIRAESSALKNRDWQSVKFYVHNRIVAYKRDNEKEETLTTCVWVEMQWYDYRLSWANRPGFEAYENITSTRVPSKSIWLPDIILENNVDGHFEITLYTNALVDPDGMVYWLPPAIYRSACAIKVNYFPFDWQNCSMVFRSQTYSANEIELKLTDEENSIVEWIEIDPEAFTENGEWIIKHRPAKKVINERFSRDELGYQEIIFFLIIQRKPLFYVINIIVPCVLFSSLGLLVYHLPAKAGGQKCTMSITILLAQTVFLFLIAKKVPETSKAVPLIGKYLMFVMSVTAITVMNCVVVLNVSLRTPNTHPMTDKVRKVLLNILPRLLRMRMQRWTPQGGVNGTVNGSTVPLRRRSSLGLIVKADEYMLRTARSELMFSRLKERDGLMRSALEKIQNGLEGDTVQDLSSSLAMASPEVQQCVASCKHIAESTKQQNDFQSENEEWFLVARVIDRLCFITMAMLFVLGTIGIFLMGHFNQAPLLPFPGDPKKYLPEMSPTNVTG